MWTKLNDSAARPPYSVSVAEAAVRSLWSNWPWSGQFTMFYYVPLCILRSERERPRRRHVDGSFTSDVSKVLDSMAAKEYLLWVMTSKPSGEK